MCYYLYVLHDSDAVRTITGFKNTKFADIIKFIMAWLRNSGDREGGRKRRREPKVKKQTNMILELQQQVREQQKLLHEQQMEVLTTHNTSSDIDEKRKPRRHRTYNCASEGTAKTTELVTSDEQYDTV